MQAPGIFPSNKLPFRSKIGSDNALQTSVTNLTSIIPTPRKKSTVVESAAMTTKFDDSIEDPNLTSIQRQVN